MPIFKINDKKLDPISEKKIDLEKDIQKLTEQNLETIFGLKFICSEFSLQDLRIDTLAFDEESKSFVIIEYKKDKSFSIVDQGYAYLALMINNKADFILEYNEKTDKNLKRNDVDWSQSRVLFISSIFTNYQQKALHFNDMPIELWEVKEYDNDTILYNQLKSPESSESIKTVSKNKTVETVSREIKKYSVEDHFKTDWKESRALYDELKEKILSLDERFEESPQKYYIGFKIGKSNVLAVLIQKSKIILQLPRVQPKDLNDPNKKAVYQKNSYDYYNKHLTDYYIDKPSDIDYGMFLAKQVYGNFIF